MKSHHILITILNWVDRYLGPSIDVGLVMTTNIIKENGQVPEWNGTWVSAQMNHGISPLDARLLGYSE